MEELANKKELLESIRLSEDKDFTYNEQAILDSYLKKEENKSGLAIKILTILGSFVAMLAFIVFLGIAGFYSSEAAMVFLGGLFIVLAVVTNVVKDNLIWDTFSVTIYITGFVMLVFGLSLAKMNEDMIFILVGLIAFSTLVITQNYILSFIAILTVNGSFLSLLLNTEVYDFIHIYVAAMALMLSYVLLKEARILSSTKKLAKLYNPLRIGVIISFIIGLSMLGKKGAIALNENYIWISSVLFIIIGMYIVHVIIKVHEITLAKTKAILYVLSFLILLSTLFSPAISGAIILLLLSFLVNYKTGLVIGIVALIYFVSQYYYDLSFTLLTKSILLFVSGVLFLACYVFTTKMLGNNEEI